MPDLRRLKAKDLEGVSDEWARPMRMLRNQDTRWVSEMSRFLFILHWLGDLVTGDLPLTPH